MHGMRCHKMPRVLCLLEMFRQHLVMIPMPFHHPTTRQMLEVAMVGADKAIKEALVIKGVVKGTRVAILEALCQVVLVIKVATLVIREIPVVIKQAPLVEMLEAFCQAVQFIKEAAPGVIKEVALGVIREVALVIREVEAALQVIKEVEAALQVIKEVEPALQVIREVGLHHKEVTTLIREALCRIKVAYLVINRATLVMQEAAPSISRVDLSLEEDLLIKEETCLEEINKQHSTYPVQNCYKMLQFLLSQ
ncbi:hypothetical protein B296_00020189 [Ensete ventricosum]|uniref:Uncharacterized protein n=1 Tax=Ensete ventricosum TaxID=4639 RepID=A0A426YWE5_ENSVE|nr:hypothetical protein B296_00020189 [Ensete ventricosum]